MKRVICIFILTFMILGTLVACAKPDDNPASTTTTASGNDSPTTTAPDSETEVDPSTLFELEEKDLGGFTLRIVNVKQSNVAWSNNTLLVDGMTGDRLNDVIYERNEYVREKYHCDITVKSVDKVVAMMDREVNAGNDEYDLYMERARELPSALTKGLLYDVSQLPYLGIDKVWWDQSFLNDTSINGVNYMFIGDLALTTSDCLYTIIYNKSVSAAYENDDLYELVYSGKWTLEKMLQLAKNVTADNGDGVFNYDDSYGIISVFSADPIYAFLAGSGVKVFDKDSDDMPFFAAAEKGMSEAFISAYEKVNEFYNGSDLFDLAEYTGYKNRDAIAAMFSTNRALFVPQVISAGPQYLLPAGVDYGYLPMPKADENQENYISHVNMGAPVFVVPKTNSHLDETSIVLEALCHYSYENLMPEYYDTCYAAKYVNDDDSANMIKIALSGRTYELGFVWGWNNLMDGIASQVKENNQSIASFVQRNASAARAEMKASVDAIGNN